MANRPTGKQRQFKLHDDEIELIDRIAERRDILRGGVPNRSEVIRRLLREEAERLRIPSEAQRG